MPITTKSFATRYDCCVREVEVEFHSRTLAAPFKLSSGTITEITEATGTVEVELLESGRRAQGKGTIYLSDLWAWPTASISHERRDLVLRNACELTASRLPDLTKEESLHPAELGLRLHHLVCNEIEVAENPPSLARAMCGSPFDAAIHDAVGQALDVSALTFYDETAQIPSADSYFVGGSASAAIAQAFRRTRQKLPAWLLLNMDEPLEAGMNQKVRQHGYYCFKVKISGIDAEADAKRVAEVYQFAREIEIELPRLSVDSNEANPDAESVMQFLEELMRLDRNAYDALEYLEQPTKRDIERHCFDWHGVSASKSVLLDEGLTDLSALSLAKSQGWSGIALKTCKGHSMLLAAAAWALENNLKISLQDLTNPGVSLIQAALLGAYLPTINGAEMNSPQFTPEANARFFPRLSSLFSPVSGLHHLPEKLPSGLGSHL